MENIRCQYCHEYIEAGAYPAHEAEHLKPRPDGQQSEYATLPPEERAQGDLADVPTVYVHVNNTNPVLREDSPERRAVAAAGAAVGHDGQEFEL